MAAEQSDTSGDIASQDLTGKTLGNYVLIRRLGRGGMANVYLARQTTLNRPVAIKVLKPELAVDKAYVTRFHREAQAAAALSQANIVQIFEVGEIEGVHFIAQEYVRGQNLRQYLGRHSVVEPILAVSIMRQVAAALQEASKQGVVHRDIKPENIMIASNGEVKVTDFGLARVLDDQRTDLTQIGITMGTPLYMSPEQAEGSRVDVRSDLYSLGITAWHMLTGRPPFEGENALAIAVKHVKEDLTPLARIRPDLPGELCRIISKLACKRPEDRFQTPAALIRELRTLEFDDVADWDQLTEKLAVSDEEAGLGMATVPKSQLEVTRQLESIMSGYFRPWWQSPGLLAGIGLMLLAGSVAGLAVAWSRPPADPLAQLEDVTDSVPRMQDAEAQYLYALQQSLSPSSSRERMRQLWKSVEDYFPQYNADGTRNWDNTLHARRAALRLAELYLDFGDASDAQKLVGCRDAMAIFNRLENESRDDESFRLTARAGQALVLGLQQELDPDAAISDQEIDRRLMEIMDGEGNIVRNIRSVYIRQQVSVQKDRRF
jgi:serine/threonine-protein kinase